METYSSSSESVRRAQSDLARTIKVMASLIEEQPATKVLDPRDGVTQTEVAIVASALLGAADIEIFELALWQAWGIPNGQAPSPTNGSDAHE